MCRHLHLPLQSGSPSVLRRMGRPITPEGYRSLILRARREIPDLAVTTDLMVGFPGESQEEFEQSLNFVEKMEFADAHTFRYSPRPGTAALKISPQVQSSVARSRSALLSEIVRESRQNFLSRFTGSIQQVLWIAADKITDSGWRSQGVTDNDLKVQAIIGEEVWNRITQVKITGHTGDMLQGEPH